MNNRIETSLPAHLHAINVVDLHPFQRFVHALDGSLIREIERFEWVGQVPAQVSNQQVEALRLWNRRCDGRVLNEEWQT